MKDHNNALKACTRAVELAPDNPELLFNLGEIFEMVGLLNMSNKYLDSAIATFKRVVNQLPNNMDAWNHLGICYKEKGQIEESKFYFDRARDIRTWYKDTPIIPKRDFPVTSFSFMAFFQISSLHIRHFPTLRIWMHSPFFHRSHLDLRQGINAGLKSSDLLIQLTIEFFFIHQNDSMCAVHSTIIREDCQGRCETKRTLKKEALFLFYCQFIDTRNIITITAATDKIEIQVGGYPLPRFDVLD